MTPHPPAVVTTTVLGPCGNGCVAKVAAASNASSTVRAEAHAGLAHGAGEDALLPGQRPGVRRRRLLAGAGDAALDQHDRHLGRSTDRIPSNTRPAVGRVLEVGEGDPGGGIVAVPLQVVGHAARRRRCRR